MLSFCPSDPVQRPAPALPDWSHLPDGLCEHISSLLPRTSQLACRLACRPWRAAFARAIAPLPLDIRWFADPALLPPPLPRPPTTPSTLSSASLHPPPPSSTAPTYEAASPSPSPSPAAHASWRSLVAALAPPRRSAHLRASFLYDSKARAVPYDAALTAALRFLAHDALPYYDGSDLAVSLPLRAQLPPGALAELAGGGGAAAAAAAAAAATGGAGPPSTSGTGPGPWGEMTGAAGPAAPAAAHAARTSLGHPMPQPKRRPAGGEGGAPPAAGSSSGPRPAPPAAWLGSRLVRLRLVRVTVTAALAEAVAALPCLATLCAAHGHLPALPQLLAAAGR